MELRVVGPQPASIDLLTKSKLVDGGYSVTARWSTVFPLDMVEVTSAPLRISTSIIREVERRRNAVSKISGGNETLYVSRSSTTEV